MCVSETMTTTMAAAASNNNNNSNSGIFLSDEALNLVSSFSIYGNLDRTNFQNEKWGTASGNRTDDNNHRREVQEDFAFLCEPTPIAEDRVVIVQNVSPMRSIQQSSSSVDNADFLCSLRNLLKVEDNCSNNKEVDDYSSLSNKKIQHSSLSPPPPPPSSAFDIKTSAVNKKAVVSSSPFEQDLLLLDHSEGNNSRGGGGRLSSSSSTSSSSSASSLRNSHNEQWNQRYSELVEFREDIGHCLVPLYWPKNPSLAHWVKRQRYQYRMKHRENKHSTLTDERQSLLEDLGFVWDSHAAGWEERWNELREFKDRFGHCNVPKMYPENQQLSVWVKCQRRQAKLLLTPGQSSNMTRDRIEKLQSLGFVFDPRSKKKKMTMVDYVAAEQQQHQPSNSFR